MVIDLVEDSNMEERIRRARSTWASATSDAVDAIRPVPNASLGDNDEGNDEGSDVVTRVVACRPWNHEAFLSRVRWAIRGILFDLISGVNRYKLDAC